MIRRRTIASAGTAMAEPTQQVRGARTASTPNIESHDPVVRRFHDLWESGARPDVHTFLGQAGPMTPERVVALLEIDQRRRWQLGERPRAESYFEMFPHLADDPRAFTLVLTETY